VLFRSDFFKNRINKKIEIVKIAPKSNLLRLFKVRHYIQQGWQDILISFLETPNFIANFSVNKKRKWALITSERNAIEDNFKGCKNKIYKFFERKSDYIVCNSYSAKDLWLKYKPEFKDKIGVIHNGVQIDKKDNLKTSFTHNGKLRITVAASLKRIKNIERLIDAIAIIDDDVRSKFEIRWYGTAEEKGYLTKEQIKNLIKEKGVDSNLILEETTQDIIDKYYNSDVVALFSTHEGMPNAILEGLAVGKPILMSEVSDYKYLANENNAITFDPNDTKSIADAISKIVNRREDELLQMGEESRKIVEQGFSIDVFSKSWIKKINEVLASRHKT
ncbi:MAG: glycosyltransferase family 4 protein, partial [Bacilli bacterium]|jgi:glycosyltransferase involved in cell wall biosynthesis|nr:glycosyltransferase family 4 protein [Bacilli bacterium]